MRPTRSGRRALSILVVLAAGSLAAACVASPAAESPSAAPSLATLAATALPSPAQLASQVAATPGIVFSPDDFWSLATPGEGSIEAYGSLAEITVASDLVVVGHPIGIVQGRDIVVDEELDEVARYATISLAIDEVVGGTVAPPKAGVVLVEVFLGADDELYPQYSESLVNETVLLFLRNKAAEAVALRAPLREGDELHYRIVSQEGYFRNVDGVVVGPNNDKLPWLQELSGTEFDVLVERVRAIVRGSPG